MNEKQREAVRETEAEIRGIPEGKHITIYIPGRGDIIRIQDTKVASKYRMLCICKGDGKRVIRSRIMGLFHEMQKGKEA